MRMRIGAVALILALCGLSYAQPRGGDLRVLVPRHDQAAAAAALEARAFRVEARALRATLIDWAARRAVLSTPSPRPR